jgi:hypothetical protein
MRLLANENFPGDAVDALRARGHDVAWVRTDAPGSSDRQVLAAHPGEIGVLLPVLEPRLHGGTALGRGFLHNRGVLRQVGAQPRSLTVYQAEAGFFPPG